MGAQKTSTVVEEPIVPVHNSFMALETTGEMVDDLEKKKVEGSTRESDTGDRARMVDDGGVEINVGIAGAYDDTKRIVGRGVVPLSPHG